MIRSLIRPVTARQGDSDPTVSVDEIAVRAIESRRRAIHYGQATPIPAYSSVYVRRRLVNIAAFVAGDTIALFAAVMVAFAARALWSGDPHMSLFNWMHLPLWWVGAFFAGLVPSWGLGAVEEFRRLTRVLFGVSAMALLLLFVLKTADEVSRTIWLITIPMTAILVPAVRMQVKRKLIRADLWGLPVAIYGASRAGREMIALLKNERGLGYNPVCAFDDDHNLWGTSVHGVPVLGPTNEYDPRAAVAILAMPSTGRDRLAELYEGPLQRYRKVILLPNLSEMPSLWVEPRDLGGTIGLEVTSNLLSPVARIGKRALDMLAVTLSAFLWVPLCVMIAFLIWLEDRRSPIYKQVRIGIGGRPFMTWKFRTMVPDAEAVLEMRLNKDPELRREWEANFKLRNDPRITVVGRVLRRFSLDELPQLLNVLKGTMSLVGPRPLPLYHHRQLSIRARGLRTRVRPGLTGFWQVSGRSDIGTDGMEYLDSYYVRNWSPWLDMVVLFRTIRIVISGQGAY
jgi:Undecaprenyl-phosphate galactose phosphotransferase WbaP